MKIMRVKQQDGTLVDIPIGVDTASSAVSAHNTSTSAHADIREEISQLSSEKVDLTDRIEELEEDVLSIQTQSLQQTPLFANSIEELNELPEEARTNLYVLPDGYIYAYIKTTITTESETKPLFTNALTKEGAYIRDGERYSQTNGAFKADDDCAIIVPVTSATQKGGTHTFRTRGGTYTGCEHPNSIYFGNTNTKFPYNSDVSVTSNTIWGTDANGDTYITVKMLSSYSTPYQYAVFNIAKGVNADTLIVTVDEEIAYEIIEGKTEITYKWTSTGHQFIPADYEERIIELESELVEAKNDIEVLGEQISNISITENATTVFSIPAYCPTPQLPADGSEGSDFNYKSTTTQDAYDYMDSLCNKYTQYITKQTMGKDASNTFDHNRYILSKAYWRAWQQENYPKMYAWTNDSTVIYSVSVSPRVGDTMYSTPYVGTVYNTVTAVNSAEHMASTRTVNGKVFTRNKDKDIEPTIVYTKPPQYPGHFATATVYDSSYGSLTNVSTVGSGYIIGADGIKYIRYPFEDRKQDKTKMISIFILSNEHGNYGDDLIPSFVVMRMAKDLCKNTENHFLKWLKENCIITMIPVGNPWGYARYLANGNTSGYCNSNAVNINRNYDTPGWETSNTDPQGGTKEDGAFGAYPGSEIETQHIMNTMQMCKPNVGISMHSPGFALQYKDMSDNAYFIHQGQGYDTSRIHKITEVLYSNYGMGGSADVGSAQHYNNCGKSPAYIQYVGAVGGLTETVTQENGTNNIYTSIAMEQAYTQMLLFLQTWCEEALDKQ